jgi:hypothetical protein
LKSEEAIQLGHPGGEAQSPVPGREAEPTTIDTFGGRIQVEWDPQAPMTPLGQLGFFVQFLKAADLFEPWVADCPLHYTSPRGTETLCAYYDAAQ